MQLRQLLEVLPPARVQGPVDIPIGKIECDSRRVAEGDLFVAVRGGEEQDRHCFVPDALANKASAIVAEEEVETGPATRVLVENCRKTLAKLAAHYYNYPDRELLTVGITGTNGKTTTAYLIRQVLEAAGRACGYVGTLGYQVGGRLEKTANTTPEAVELYALLQGMVKAGKEAAVLEVSSHALALERVAGLGFDAAVFTNLSRDHLNFHGSDENYFNAKARLFEDLKKSRGARAIINADDGVAPRLLERLDVPVFTFGYGSDAMVCLQEEERMEEGMSLQVRTPGGKIQLQTRLTGRFNCYNVLAAISCGLALEIKLEAICNGIADLEKIPGRFERIVAGQGFEVLVDYAHTPVALETVLEAARELTQGRLICAFGCGGDRDRGKRPLMGKVAADLADLVYVTSDNPRTESPGEIIDEIVAGMPGDGAVRIFPDRREAIHKALGTAMPGDVVVIAGKGHEMGQDLGARVVDFDDRQVAREGLREIMLRGGTREHGG